MIASNILQSIGRTPLVRFHRFLEPTAAEGDAIDLIVKLESANPGGSAKDRPARQMIEAALASGDLRPGGIVVESSSGNMGIGLAQACRFHGLHFICVVDPHAQPQNIAIIRALGGSVIRVSEPIGGSYLSARLAKVQEILRTRPGAFWTNQYANRENPQAHLLGTVREIDEALEGELDHLFVAVSSTGTLQGCRQYFAGRPKPPKLVAVDAHGSVLFGGQSGTRHISGLGAGVVPPLATECQCDRVVRVSDLDCVVGCRRAAMTEATLVGGSAGGVLQAIRSLRHTLRGKRVVAILHDHGQRYLETIYNDDWVERTLGAEPSAVAMLAANADEPMAPTLGVDSQCAAAKLPGQDSHDVVAPLTTVRRVAGSGASGRCRKLDTQEAIRGEGLAEAAVCGEPAS